MADNPFGPDVDAGVIAYLRPLFPTSGSDKVTFSDVFPLDGAFAAGQLVVARCTFAATVDPRFTSTAETTVDVWMRGRKQALLAAKKIAAALTRVGGFPLVEDGERTGVVTQGVATLLPIRTDSGDPNNVYVRYVATYDLSVRATAAA